MKLHDLFEYVESDRFSAFINAASGLSVVLLEFDNNAAVQTFIKRLTSDSEKAAYDRLVFLAGAMAPDQVEHPRDAALAAYLYVLNKSNSNTAQQAIEHILQTPNLWWARRLAQHYKQEAETESSS